MNESTPFPPQRDIEAFAKAVEDGDVARVRQLLAVPHVREAVDEPMFAFGQRATHVAARSEPMLMALIEAGADVRLKSDWANGPFTVLDHADERTARFLMTHGATLTPNVAARLGWLDELEALVEADPTAVHARGGDGRQPLHEAGTVEVADFLLDHDAAIDERCIDHRSTPAQYALVDRPDVCRGLLARGASPDIYMAARLGDVELATRLLDADASCAAARVHEPGYAPVPPLHIYCWSLGFGLSPRDVAKQYGHRDVLDVLVARSSSHLLFLDAVLAADEAAARALLAAEPSLLSSLAPSEHRHLAQAIFHERFAAADLMLRLGFDPAAPAVDGGTALHAACWVGSSSMVASLLQRGGVPLDARDSTHGSTPLGWAAFGSAHRRAPGADYPAVAERLVAAGADIGAVGNKTGSSLLEMAQGSPAMQEALRRLGAT
jgi:Ankyrin repeat